jgi:hypothetical protein
LLLSLHLLLPLPLLLPLLVSAVILSAAKDPDALDPAKTINTFRAKIHRVPHPLQSYAKGGVSRASATALLSSPESVISTEGFRAFANS